MNGDIPYDDRLDHHGRFSSERICSVCGQTWGSHYGRWCDLSQSSEFVPTPIVPLAPLQERMHIGQFVLTRTPGKLHIRCGEGEGGEFAEGEFEKAVAAFYSANF